jgi:FAD/FMN-containing dehydrogenase
MVRAWTQGLVDTLVAAYNPGLFLASHVAGGAVARVGETDTAFPHRNAEVMLVFVSGWMDPSLDEKMIADTRALYGAAEPYMGGYYDNIEFDHDAGAGNYGPAYPRLQQIKAQYDRNNLFRLNSNVLPAV